MQAKKRIALAVLITVLGVSPTMFAAEGVAVPVSLPHPVNELDARILAEYGAVQVAGSGVVPPPAAMFGSEQEVADWQARVPASTDGMVLQTAAAEALAAAQAEAKRSHVTISPRAADSAVRSYEDTLMLWRSRVEPGLEHWVARGHLSREEASQIRSMPVREQVAAILQLENEGMYFSRDFSKSILSSVAPPGASQHLAMLAFDVKEHADARVRAILERHGWFQTVARDCPHFTYLGVAKAQLPALGLTRIVDGDRQYWVPRRAEVTVKFARR